MLNQHRQLLLRLLVYLLTRCGQRPGFCIRYKRWRASAVPGRRPKIGNMTAGGSACVRVRLLCADAFLSQVASGGSPAEPPNAQR
eukprot:9480041-Pyramimonas_sp.AAC.1